MEVGGRWSEEAATFVRLLAKAKARAFPSILRRSLQLAYQQRWTGLLAVAAQRALASTLLELPVDEAAADGEEVWVEEVLREARLLEAPHAQPSASALGRPGYSPGCLPAQPGPTARTHACTHARAPDA